MDTRDTILDEGDRQVTAKEGANMPYIRTVGDAEATGELAEIYERLKATGGGVANINRIMSLNPGVLKGALQLRDGFRRGSPRIDGRRREMIATVASSLLRCTY